VRTLNDHFKSEPKPPDLRPSSNVDFPVAWITGPATDPSLESEFVADYCVLGAILFSFQTAMMTWWPNLENLNVFLTDKIGQK
jgi:hypothetical protein